MYTPTSTILQEERGSGDRHFKEGETLKQH